MAKLKFIKWINGVDKPIIHYYAVCWNEEKMLPFMFDYYEKFVDKFTIFDNYSTDNSEEIFKSHKNTDIIKFKTEGINDFVHIDIKNNCWKRSRGRADYVIVCDIDEFIYHPDIITYLSESLRNRLSFFYPDGFDMYSNELPKYKRGRLLTNIVQTGVPSAKYAKCILFNPNKIVEINYELGAHICHPYGQIKSKEDNDLKLLHYNNLSLEKKIKRQEEYAERLSMENIRDKLGIEYLNSRNQITDCFMQGMASSKKII